MNEMFEDFKKRVCINCSCACDTSEEFIRQCIEELDEANTEDEFYD